jgi:hypothetical protein
MKKFTVCAAIAVVSAFAGFEFNNYWYNNEGLYEANKFKRELVNAQAKALNLADKVMDRNDLWDADGSDIMSDYLDAVAKVDSLYKTQE